MKKIIGVIAAVCVMAAFIGCASAPSAGDGIQKARSGAPSGSLVASATAKDAAASEKEAKEQLIKAMVAMTNSIIQEAAGANEINNTVSEKLIQETNNALSRSSLNSAIKQGQGEGKGKVFWTVFYMEKSDVVREINNAVNAAKQSVPGSESFNTASRIDAKYQAAVGRTWSN